MSTSMPQIINSSYEASHEGVFVFEGITILLASCAGLVTNIFNLLVVPRLPGTSLASKIFYNILFSTDIAFSLTAFLTLPGFFLRRWVFGDKICLIFILVWNTYPRVTSTFLFLLAIDRYIYVTRPLRYGQIVTNKRTWAMTIFSLCLDIFAVTVSNYFNSESSRNKTTFDQYVGACTWGINGGSSEHIKGSVWLFISFVTIVGVQSHIACITRRHLRSLKARENMAPRSTVKNVSIMQETRAESSGVTSVFSNTNRRILSEKPIDLQDNALAHMQVTSVSSKTHLTLSKTTSEPANSDLQESALAGTSGHTKVHHLRHTETFPIESGLIDVSDPIHSNKTNHVMLQEIVQPLIKEVFPKVVRHPRQGDPDKDPTRPSTEWKAVKLAILVSGAFFFGFLPEDIYKTIAFITGRNVYQVYVTVHILYMNRMWWNALIFYYGRNVYRLKVRRLFRCLEQNRVMDF